MSDKSKRIKDLIQYRENELALERREKELKESEIKTRHATSLLAKILGVSNYDIETLSSSFGGNKHLLILDGIRFSVDLYVDEMPTLYASGYTDCCRNPISRKIDSTHDLRAIFEEKEVTSCRNCESTDVEEETRPIWVALKEFFGWKDGK